MERCQLAVGVTYAFGQPLLGTVRRTISHDALCSSASSPAAHQFRLRRNERHGLEESREGYSREKIVPAFWHTGLALAMICPLMWPQYGTNEAPVRY